MKFHLYGDDTKIEVDIMSRSHPDCHDFWDGNWVTSDIKITIPGYIASFIAYLRTDELQDFLNEIKDMNTKLRGKAILKNLDSYLHFEAKMNRFGKINWSIETTFPNGDGAVLTFQFSSDQSHLPLLIKEIEQILIAFPVIGTP